VERRTNLAAENFDLMLSLSDEYLNDGMANASSPACNCHDNHDT
jgi:hypothetical protein